MKPQELKELEAEAAERYPYPSYKGGLQQTQHQQAIHKRVAYIEGRKDQAEKSKKKEGEFAEWCAENFDFLITGLWESRHSVDQFTTAQLYAIFEEERGKG